MLEHIASLHRRNISQDDEYDWNVKTWPKQYNNGSVCPLLNQISIGLIKEAMVQVQLAMGDVREQQYQLAAKANIKKTWQDLLDDAKVTHRDKPLETCDDNYEPIKGGLLHPTSPVVGLMVYIY